MVDQQYKLELCVWELTLKCNMRCLHCGSVAGKPRENELTIEECFVIADELLELGCKQVTFIGGEVFLYKGWERIARRLSDGGAQVNMITNGYLMGDEQIREIRYAGLANVGISVDGMKENHDRIRNMNGSFDRVLDAFERLRKEEIEFGVVTSLMEINYKDLEAMYRLFLREGVNLWQLQIVTGMGNVADKRTLLLKPQRVPSITRFIREKQGKDGMYVYAGDDIGYFNEDEDHIRNSPRGEARWQGCQAGLRVVGITSTGDVKGCESLYSDDFVEGNLRKQSLAAIWYNQENFSYNRKFHIEMLTGNCRDCDKGLICRGGCRGSCFFTSGSKYENPYCCYPGKAHDE